MNRSFCLALTLLLLGTGGPQADPTPSSTPSPTPDPSLQKYFSWLDEIAPGRKNTELSPEVTTAIDSEGGQDVIADFLRGGPEKKNELAVPKQVESVRLQPVQVLGVGVGVAVGVGLGVGVWVGVAVALICFTAIVTKPVKLSYETSAR